MKAPITIFVTGANGQLGRSIREIADTYMHMQFVFFGSSEFPIEDIEKGEALFKEHRPQFCINCAAYTAVDKAESERDTADLVNGYAPGRLALLCKKYNSRLLHISTDYVFNGMASEPYLESDPVEPVNAYGASKLLGETEVIKHAPHSLVVRTSWVYAPFGNNFVKTMLRLMGERSEINVVADQLGSPTYAPDLAEALIQMIERCIKNPETPGGIYHFSNDGIISWFDFASAIRKLTGSPCKVNPIPTSAYPTPAKRPAYSGLNKSKIVSDFGIVLKPWEESLKNCLKALGVN